MNINIKQKKTYYKLLGEFKAIPIFLLHFNICWLSILKLQSNELFTTENYQNNFLTFFIFLVLSMKACLISIGYYCCHIINPLCMLVYSKSSNTLFGSLVLTVNLVAACAQSKNNEVSQPTRDNEQILFHSV